MSACRGQIKQKNEIKTGVSGCKEPPAVLCYTLLLRLQAYHRRSSNSFEEQQALLTGCCGHPDTSDICSPLVQDGRVQTDFIILF